MNTVGGEGYIVSPCGVLFPDKPDADSRDGGCYGVQINISSRHGQLANESRQRISSKLEKLGRFHDRVASVDATIDLENEEAPDVEVRVGVDGAAPFVARAHGPSLLGAVEGAIQKLEQQLRRHKEKLIGSHRNPHRRESVTSSMTDLTVDDEELGDEEE